MKAKWLTPIFFEVHFLGLVLWQWLGLILLAIVPWIVFRLAAGFIIRFLGALFTRKGSTFDERFVILVRTPLCLVLTIVVFSTGRRSLDLDVPVQDFLRVTEGLLWVLSAAWLTFRFVDVAALTLRARAESRGNLALVPVMDTRGISPRR